MNPDTRGCKRIVGMPGDYVCVVSPAKEAKDVLREDMEVLSFKEDMFRVPEGHCWVAGDNLDWSRDSRMFGPLPLNLITGKAVAVVWPWADTKWC
jgi:mitochondrial inner membrane protease subunit 1